MAWQGLTGPGAKETNRSGRKNSQAKEGEAKVSGVGGANFKGNPAETERKYQLVRELQAKGKFLKDACREAGISVVYYRKLMKNRGDESIAGQGDRNKTLWGDDSETGNTLSPGESKAVFEHAKKYDPLWDSANRDLGGPGLPPMRLGSFSRSRIKKIRKRQTPSTSNL